MKLSHMLLKMTLALRFGLEEARVLEHSLPAQAYKRQGVIIFKQHLQLQRGQS